MTAANVNDKLVRSRFQASVRSSSMVCGAEFTTPRRLLIRITRDPRVMGGKPCIRGMRVTVGTVVGLVAAGRTKDDILREYPYLEAADIAEALSYAAWRAEEVEVPLSP